MDYQNELKKFKKSNKNVRAKLASKLGFPTEVEYLNFLETTIEFHNRKPQTIFVVSQNHTMERVEVHYINSEIIEMSNYKKVKYSVDTIQPDTIYSVLGALKIDNKTIRLEYQDFMYAECQGRHNDIPIFEFITAMYEQNSFKKEDTIHVWTANLPDKNYLDYMIDNKTIVHTTGVCASHYPGHVIVDLY